MQNTEVNQPSTNDSWETRIKDASVVLGKTPKEVTEILSTLGVEEVNGLEMLSDEEITPFGDLRRAFCEEANVKIAQLRMAVKYLRGPKDSEKASNLDTEQFYLQQTFGIKGVYRLSDVDPTELIPAYNPAKNTSRITNALKRHFGDKPVIAFKPGSKDVAVEETIDYIADLAQGFPEEEAIEVDGSLVHLYPVGVVPDQTIDEDPLFKNQPLRRDRSTINRANWSSVSHEARVFCRLIVESDEIDPTDKLAVRELIRLAEKGHKDLKEVYPEIDLKYRQMEEDNELPRLKVKINDIKSVKTQNPFGVSRNY